MQLSPRTPVHRATSSVLRKRSWRATLGAVPDPLGTRFAVWAPTAQSVLLDLGDRREPVTMDRDEAGRFSRYEPGIGAGARYAFRINGGNPLPDPATRSQPEGVHGYSHVVDPASFEWSDSEWQGIDPARAVIYELHVGTFSPEGTFAGVEAELGYVRELGATAIELMPIAEFPGRWNWGYDGVDLFAPSHQYGEPDDLRRLVNAAHMHGLAVILDVVYNHLGPDGAYLSAYSPHYFSSAHQTPWGAAVNLHGEHSSEVRAFFIENALHWVHEYHLDGLRLDATHALIDTSQQHFLEQLAAEVKSSSARPIYIVAEDERNEARLVTEPPRGYGLDAVWSDDFHHQIRTAVAGDRHGYFADFSGTADAIAATIRQGWFYTGQHVDRLGCPRGSTPLDLPHSRFVVCLQNHDQVGNRAFGDRLHHKVPADAYLAVSTLLLLGPETPLLFMGQEWSASSPFCYFTDHEPALGGLVTDGRRQEFAAFPEFADPLAREAIPNPQAESTFASSRLRWDERSLPKHSATLAWYKALLTLRSTEPALHDDRRDRLRVSPLDESTLLMLRGVGGNGDIIGVVVRWAGEGIVDIAGPCRQAGVDASRISVELTTGDPAFSGGGSAVVTADPARGTVTFTGPGAAVLRARS
jgi:maltooligosyltrehalose trehalohydrolase